MNELDGCFDCVVLDDENRLAVLGNERLILIFDDSQDFLHIQRHSSKLKNPFCVVKPKTCFPHSCLTFSSASLPLAR